MDDSAELKAAAATGETAIGLTAVKGTNDG